MPDGSFFNANATIAESFKMMEDAIAASGANESKDEKEGGERKTFMIGLNCDGD
jgi:hypothetical protein